MVRCIVALALAALASLAAAQGYPSKTVRIIVPHPPGAPADVPPRGIAEALSRTLGQPFVIENRDGADGIIGAEACAKSAADGYTLCSTTSSIITLNGLLRTQLPYDGEHDFAPIACYGSLTGAIVAHPSVPANNLRELVELARAKPDSVTWATLGTTSAGPLYIAWFRNNAGASFFGVPYKSTQQGFQATISGQVNVVTFALGPVVPQVRAGKVKALAVSATRRSPQLPDVPTVRESGYDVNLSTWFGLFAPRGVPRDVSQRLNAEVVKLVSEPAFRAKFVASQGLDADELGALGVDEFAAFIRSDRELVARSLAAAGVQKQ
jgi:tripartite-type tricarboxylate transporter receptor subunit TctC